jgi:hypothetical protein
MRKKKKVEYHYSGQKKKLNNRLKDGGEVVGLISRQRFTPGKIPKAAK